MLSFFVLLSDGACAYPIKRWRASIYLFVGAFCQTARTQHFDTALFIRFASMPPQPHSWFHVRSLLKRDSRHAGPGSSYVFSMCKGFHFTYFMPMERLHDAKPRNIVSQEWLNQE